VLCKKENKEIKTVAIDGTPKTSHKNEYWQLSLFLLSQECIENMPVFHSKLLSPYLSTGGNKLPIKIFDSNFLLLLCRLGRAAWQTRMSSGWRGYVWECKKKWRISR
jgi:hypothetical protein